MHKNPYFFISCYKMVKGKKNYMLHRDRRPQDHRKVYKPVCYYVDDWRQGRYLQKIEHVFLNQLHLRRLRADT